MTIVIAVFFSSRRRHTRCSRDWSSDVCSSVLVESSQGGQQTIQGTVQRVRIEARSCWFGLGRFLKNCLWCLWGRNGICRAFRNRGRWSGRIGPGQKRKRGFRSRPPAQSTESFPDHFLVETDPSSDPAIAEALGFEAQNDSVARGDVGYRILCGSPLRPDQGIQSSPVQALLKTA